METSLFKSELSYTGVTPKNANLRKDSDDSMSQSINCYRTLCIPWSFDHLNSQTPHPSMENLLILMIETPPTGIRLCRNPNCPRVMTSNLSISSDLKSYPDSYVGPPRLVLRVCIILGN